jgi:4-hydroxy-tetrahydrodipicolinate reductase
MKKPYRVIVWGPGGLGTVAIWEILQSKAFELVGVRAYGEAKNGQDVGSLLGIPPVGIKMSTDVDALLNIECDCVLMTARDMGNFNTDEEILKILAAGRNIVTPLPYHNAHLVREQAFLDKLDAACQKGKSVFHATGIDPDLVSERVVPALTGMCADMTSLSLQENWDATYTATELLVMTGFSKSPEEAAQVPVAAAISTNFLKSIGYTMEQTFGVKYSRVEETHEYIVAKKDIQSVNINIKAGTVGCVTHRFRCYVEDRGPDPFFTMEYNWFIGGDMLPEGVKSGEKWIVAIEGRPSMRMVVDLRASLKNEDRNYKIGSISTEPGYHGTIAPCLQAIPLVCEAKPGLLPSFGPGLHWTKDFRDLAKSHD